MSRTVSTSSGKNRPSPLSSKSFARYEPPAHSPPSHRSRASTVQSPVTVKSPRQEAINEDVFDKRNAEDEDAVSPSLSKSTSLPDKFDELPIEIASLVDRFVESLSARIYSEPPTADQLAQLFQEFYIRASASIATHISTLISRLNRDKSPTPPATASKSKPPSKEKSSDSLAPSVKSGGYQQLLTASEVTEKRKARRLLEYKRILLEEAVERTVCEKVYGKLWQHKSTLDEVRDEKLRSKTAALALVGIGLKDLGMETDPESTKTLEDVQQSLTLARDGLARMTEEHYPLGKLQLLTAAHKAIVDTLYSIHPSSASADDILPTLIYTLVTSPIEGINAISNLYFVQRFRNATKLDGEAAYCMTNLEAAVSFLENVDLASLREDEVPEGPRKPSDVEEAVEDKVEAFPNLPSTTLLPPAVTSSDSASTATAPRNETTPAMSSRASLEKQMPLPQPRHNRTLSDLLVPITNAPESVRSTAEESLKNISSTLDNSFKFFFGKLREQSAGPGPGPLIPKTLDEARQLVSRPLTPDGELDATISETSSLAGDSTTNTPPSGPAAAKLTPSEDKVLNLFGGRRRTGSLNRDRSADSQRSTASNSSSNPKRVVFAATGSSSDLATVPSSSSKPVPAQSQQPQQQQPPSSSNPLDSMKNFTATMNINPISHLSSIGNISNSFPFRPFGGGGGTRSSTSQQASPIIPPAPSSTPLNMNTAKHLHNPPAPASSAAAATNTIPEISLRPPLPHEILEIKSQPPNPRFLSLESAADLRLSEVADLLSEYQRIARVLEGLRVVGEEEAGMV